MARKKKSKEEVYQVEVITKARVSEDGEWEYFVKWAGYGSDSDSWEPSENVQQCERLLTSFWKHIGMDDNDYTIGYEVRAAQSWINKEKRYFAETFVKPSKRKSDKATRMERQKSKLSISESTSEEEPPATIHVEKKLGRKARAVDTDFKSKSEPESESDVPFHKQVMARPKATSPPLKEHLKVPVQAERQEMSLATGSSLPNAPPKATVVRTHQDQRTNPLVKPMDLPSGSVEAGSSLFTKQRIAAGIPPAPTGPKPLPLAPKKSLPPLSFKKNKPPVLSITQVKDVITSSTSATTPMSPVAEPANIIDNADVVVSPQPMDIDQPNDLFGSIWDDIGPPGGSLESTTVPIPQKTQEEIDAEKFLQTINIPMLDAPLETDMITDQSDQPIPEVTKSVAISKIPKKWRWSGDLFISTSDSETKLLCAVIISDSSAISNSSHINLLLSSLSSLQISKLYSIMDLPPVFRACGKPQYFGRLEPCEPSEEITIDGLGHHLKNEGLAAVIPLFLDGTEVAVLIVFPRAQQGLVNFLQVPDHLLSGPPLLVVLLPLLVSALTSTKVVGQRSIEMVQKSLQNTEGVLMPHNLPQEALLHQRMFLLGFPKSLLDFLNNSPTPRSYCVWGISDQLLPGLDIIMLQYILKSTKAVSAKLEEDVRVIFISNRNLEMVHTIPSLVTKRANSPEVQFWTYGYSSNLGCERWRFKEIYPLGGILTFTPSALVEDLVGCCRLISQIIEHPLWECYLIPEVLAASYLLSSDGDISSPSESCLSPILDLIEDGLISVMKMPEEGQSGQVAWLSQVFAHSNASGNDLLEVYLGVLRSNGATSSMTSDQLITFITNQITKDLSKVQIQPAFMENYRRFVVIRAASEDAIPFDKNGLEWLQLSQFSFKDDYFQL